MQKLSKAWIFKLLFLAVMSMAVVSFHATKASAACQPSGNFGSVTFDNNVSIPLTGTYRVWSRIQIPSSANNNYLIEIDGTCYTVGGNGSLTLNSWAWVDYQPGGSKINVQLSQGKHTVKMYGTSDGVLLDRVLFTQVNNGSTCTPAASGNGDDCAEAPDTTAPTVSIAQPAAGATVNGTVAVRATASDNSGTVSKVEFFINGATTPAAVDTSSPFVFDWDTTKVADGAYNINAKAYDSSGNIGISANRTVNVLNGKPDFIVSGITWSPAAVKAGDKVTFTATVKNQGSASGSPADIKFEIGSSTVSLVNSSSALAVGSTRAITATGTWTAVAGTQTIKVTADNASATVESNENNNSLALGFSVGSVDTTAPTVSLASPANGSNLSGAVEILVNASDSGGSGLSRVELYVNGKLIDTKTASPYKFNWDTTKISNGNYTVYTVALDSAGNKTQSSSVTVSISNQSTVRKPGDANGDDRVNGVDLSILSTNWGKSGRTWEQADFNGDGSVSGVDLSILSTNWNK
ncbi:hypothetical protein KDA11_03040 [Candidatus Saccharibacteria bacterium]|nr:hypothetical protein [Candidatus Saccharibacteria bacterium]